MFLSTKHYKDYGCISYPTHSTASIFEPRNLGPLKIVNSSLSSGAHPPIIINRGANERATAAWNHLISTKTVPKTQGKHHLETILKQVGAHLEAVRVQISTDDFGC